MPLLKVAIVALVLCLTYFVAAAPAHAAEGPFYIHGDRVNLRESPSGAIDAELALNEKLFIIERDGDWCHVSLPARELKGWVHSSFIGKGRLAADNADQAEGDVQDNAAPETPIESPDNVVEVCITTGETLTIRTYAPADSGFIPDNPTGEPGNAGKPDFAVVPEEDLLTPQKALEQVGGKSASAISPAAVEQDKPLSFKPGAQVTTPMLLENSFYQPVGGHDLALIRGTNVNVRKEASLKSGVLTKVSEGDKLYVVSYNDPWYFVSIPEQKLRGWVFGEYVDELPRVEVSGTNVRMREAPGLDARVKTELDTGEVFFEFKRKNGWVLVASSASGVKGWIHEDYLRKTEKSASRPYTVNGEDVNFRASPNVDAVILAQLPNATQVEVQGRNEKWSFIAVAGQKGWMYSQYLSPLGRGTVVPHSPIAQRLIARAKEMQGTPYVWGGESDGGVDCSGLIYKLLCDEGCDAGCLPRRASEQMAQLGAEVDKESLEPGDLVFFSTYKPGPSHVGIYIGDGDFIHASSARSQVTVNSMSEGYYRERFCGARRITEDELKKLQ